VLRVLFSSALVLENSATFEKTPAPELVARWLGEKEGTTVAISAQRLEARGSHKVDFHLSRFFHEEGTGIDVMFQFTLNGDRIVEDVVRYLPIS
jgi:hypothetical protein